MAVRWWSRIRWMAAGVWQRLTRACLVCSMTRSAPPPRHLLTSPPSLALMPIPMSTNLDSRCLICHESITTIDILSSPFDPASSYCPILIPTLLKTGDMATLSLAWGQHGVPMVHIMGPKVTCSALLFEYLKVVMSGECLVPFVLPFLLHIVTCEGRVGNLGQLACSSRSRRSREARLSAARKIMTVPRHANF